MKDTIKEWIRQHLSLIDEEEYTYFIVKAYDELDYSEFIELLTFFDTKNFFDTTYPKLEAFAQILVRYIEQEKEDTLNKYQDPSNSWSRLQYCYSAIGGFRLKYEQIVDYLIANKNNLGIKMNPLTIEYGWEGADDYDLGYFKPDVFKKMYPENFEEV